MKLSELLTDESKWVQGHLAISKYDRETSGADPDAIKWCLMGAISKCSDNQSTEWWRMYYSLRNSIKDLFGTTRNYKTTYDDVPYIQDFNDNNLTTFEDVKVVIEHSERN